MENYQFTKSKESELGKGSYSVVYLGLYKGPDTKHILLGTQVAIKVIKTKNLSAKARSILDDEISVMEMIKYDPHPNIVGCYDVIQGNDELYIIMEYCDSGDFRSILKKPIKEKYAQFYFSQLANGLSYLDRNCIIHRDIKPKNILLTNKRRFLKIADFGFAKKVKEQSLHETMCGSPLYMSPEILSNNMYNNQSDLWSIGMILYEMLYGFHPFISCRSLPELKEAVAKMTIDIPPLDTKNKDVSDDCITLLEKLLQKQANNRMSWDDFFNHPWIKTKEGPEYVRQLHSTSLGSLARDEEIVTKMPHQYELVEDYFEQVEKSVSVKHENKYTDDHQNSKTSFAPSFDKDECIFEMEFDDQDKGKKIIIKKIMEKSSVLDDKNDYDFIDLN
jgi:serine/threonine-protein kinase ULK/ATG1